MAALQFATVWMALLSACVLPATADICTKDVCEFHLNVRRIRTMTYQKPDGSATYNVGLQTGTNKLVIVPNTQRVNGSDPMIGTEVKAEDVVTAGGFVRNVITVNDQFPGPALEVMEGAEVVVQVTNHLKTDGISIHWHGLYMRKTPWMDGVSFISQCPVQPRQSFTYRFRAYPAGTHWYHAHFENLRLDGMYGMFVVHKQLPAIPQHHAMIADWLKMSSGTFEILYKGTKEINLPTAQRDFSPDGIVVGAIDHNLYNTIINGRGKGQNGEAYPLQVYTVTPGRRVRVRVVHAGVQYVYYVSVDGHKIDVVASDGYELSPLKVTHIIIQPGESMDFELTADEDIGNYWMRVRSIKGGVGPDVIPDDIVHEGRAIVRYEGAQEIEPTSRAHDCTEQTPCSVFNCPFAGYAYSAFTKCFTFNDAKSTIPKSSLDSEYGVSDKDFIEYFFSFAASKGGNIGGTKFVNPTVPLYQPHDDAVVDCDGLDCTNGCQCTQFLKLPFNKTVQMVFTNMNPKQAAFSHHPVHVHGHGFAVLKMGLPEFDNATGKASEASTDITCDGNYCTPARWNGGKAPMDLNQENPPVKDTITVPARGYVILRFRTDNPGYWLVHCHTEQHIISGMTMVFDEAPELEPSLPKDFPTCNDFRFNADEFSKYDSVPYGQTPKMKPEYEKEKDLGHEEGGMENTRNIGDDEFVVKLPVAIGSAVGFILLGAIIAVVPALCILTCRKKK